MSNSARRWFVAAVALMLGNTWGWGAPRASSVFFVAPWGDDRGAGSADRPFRTISRAQEAVRRVIGSGLKEDVVVNIREGTYSLTVPLSFDEGDSGTEMFSVTYAGSPGEHAILSGGRVICGRWVRDIGNRWKINIPEVASGDWWFRDLFADGYRQTRARYPNFPSQPIAHWTSGSQQGITLDRDLPVTTLGSDSNAEVVMFGTYACSRAGIQSINGRTISFSSPTDPPNADACYLEHALEFVDMPGEWYLERATGTLFYMAGDQEDPNEKVFTAPVLGRILNVSGTMDLPLNNLRFSNLTFEYNDWPFPAATSYSELYSGDYYYAPNGWQFLRSMPPAILVEYATRCQFENCRIYHTSSAGIGFGRGVTSSAIRGCEVADVGGAGIRLGWRGNVNADGWITTDWATGKGSELNLGLAWQDARNVPANNEVSSNYVHRTGQTYHGCIGIQVDFQYNFSTTYNLVRDIPYSGLDMSNYRGDSTDACNYSYNHVHHANSFYPLMEDGGGMYESNSPTGARIEGNVLHDLAVYCLYLDESGDNCLVSQNVWYRSGGIFAHSVSGESVFGNNGNPTPTQIECADGLAGPRPPYRLALLAGLLPNRPAFSAISAADCYTSSGVEGPSSGDARIRSTIDGAYASYALLDFGGGAREVSFQFKLDSPRPNSAIEVHLDGVDGPLVARCPIGNSTPSAGWETATFPVSGAGGVRDTYLVFTTNGITVTSFAFAGPGALTAGPGGQKNCGLLGIEILLGFAHLGLASRRKRRS